MPEKLYSRDRNIYAACADILTGMSGMTIGAFAGVIRSTTPTLFALASGIQWFALGTTFWGQPSFSRDKVLLTIL